MVRFRCGGCVEKRGVQQIGTTAVLLVLAALPVAVGGCGAEGAFLNPAFINTFVGGQFPLTPGPGAAFVMVRVVNETQNTAEFTVTIEREDFVLDEDGNRQFDDLGNPITESKRQTVRLQTFATAPANELGILFSCSPSPVDIVGLGENLLPNDPAVFIGGEGGGGTPGAGVTAADVAPLVRTAGNFNCGDTIIFRASPAGGIVDGTVNVQSLLLPGSEQPSEFAGPSTFTNYAQFLESQQREDD